MLALTLTLLLSLAAQIHAGQQQYELSNGTVVTLSDDESQFVAAKPAQQDSVGAISPRDLFGRQYCSTPGANIICGTGCCYNYKLCCERSNCFDPSFYKCCSGGGACPKGGDCCLNNRCCDAGSYCVRNLDTNAISCRSGSGAATYSYSSIRLSTNVITSSATASAYVGGSTFSCFDRGYTACANSKFCCPSGNYCFYNTLSQPRCFSTAYYYYTYTYSWSYSFGIRYFRTTTSYYLGGSAVAVITTPSPPTTPPPTTASIAFGGSSTTPRATASTDTLLSGSSALGGGASETASSGSSASAASTTTVAASQGSGAGAARLAGATEGLAGWVAWAVMGQFVAAVLGFAIWA